MNYSELQAAILSDSQRADYQPYIARFIEQGEALIEMTLRGYFLDTTIDETNRVLENVYSLPAKVTKMRTVTYNNVPLTQTDETSIALFRSSTAIASYCMRNAQILFAGIPPVDSVFQLQYYGMPARLTDALPINNLLTDYPQLYIEAAQVYVFKRARNLEMSSAAFQSVQSCIREINKKMREKLSGGEAAPVYNTSFRSSY